MILTSSDSKIKDLYVQENLHDRLHEKLYSEVRSGALMLSKELKPKLRYSNNQLKKYINFKTGFGKNLKYLNAPATFNAFREISLIWFLKLSF